MQANHAARSPRARPAPTSTRRRGQAGFSILELSAVLVVIGLIVGAVTIGRDVQRNAVYQRIASDFVQGWAIAYDSFFTGTGRPPGDSAVAPTGIVNGAIAAPRPQLCGADLLNAMQAAGVDLPTGRTEGAADRYVYLDSNGNPQELTICFSNEAWSEPGAAVGTFVTRPRNVMVLNGMTPALATLLDNSFDSHVDATFGRFREQAQANNVNANHPGLAWSRDDRFGFADAVVPVAPQDEAQVGVVNAFLKMTR
ncbi:type II secretion system protein [Rhodoferax ferrireducens]|uniref:type II secretion system protein n=1 Tax=Rhodoferax ferrireducens TaxID=192843 RepID=UPI000E0D8654|nr:prepilin-type N-terminal cleavage/methylation domain-containing protein [Rhodoferax ferrireducens]